MSASLEPDRLTVLARYGAAAEGLRWVALGSGGGFSGAHLWRGEDESGAPTLALKAWPPDGMTAERLTRIHGWMARAAHLPFVPPVLPTQRRFTATTEADRVWDLTRWMPGTADFHANPTPARLANACTALAHLHRAWAPLTLSFAPCPAVQRRLRILHDWQSQAASFTQRSHLASGGREPPEFVIHSGGSRPPLASSIEGSGSQSPVTEELDAAFRRGIAAATQHAGAAERALLPWAVRPVPVRPCLCDVWHDHVLFTGDTVTGIIDYGAMKEDHVAVDLARLLGDLIQNDDAAFTAGLESYSSAGGRLEMPAEFARLLDRTGVVCGIITWLVRIAKPDAAYPVRAVAARLNSLTARVGPSPPF